MNQPLPGGAQWVQRTTPEEVIKRTLGHRIDQRGKTKLTWNRGDIEQAPQDRIVGDVNLSLPYIRIGTDRHGMYFYIQNARIYKSNGVETTLKDIFGTVSDASYLAISQAYDSFIASAVVRDPALCKICKTYRAESYEDFAKHTFNEHPASVLEQIKEDAVPVAAPAAQEVFSCCGRTFKDKRGLGAHQRFGKCKRV
jgi:hypothetical protein